MKFKFWSKKNRKETEYQFIFLPRSNNAGRYLRVNKVQEKIRLNLGHHIYRNRNQNNIIKNLIYIIEHETIHGAVTDCVALNFLGCNKKSYTIITLDENEWIKNGDEEIMAKLVGFENKKAADDYTSERGKYDK